ncbi:hypothetical protein HGO38_11340 [Rhizobium sp. CG5]|uniref:hypothetical protein n=1 Tax=Rhizobium sp. CG5 TaxID=2726076 RepID=UPI0020348EE7|nr:hypothetical protein [Rhizobium sp. CG5]MCM2474066.1 hypothetical protein [Rhizobium sp. CG5]
MTASVLGSAASTLRVALMAFLLLGPLAALGFSQTGPDGVSKQGAGLVLLVSLQRQSLS